MRCIHHHHHKQHYYKSHLNFIDACHNWKLFTASDLFFCYQFDCRRHKTWENIITKKNKDEMMNFRHEPFWFYPITNVYLITFTVLNLRGGWLFHLRMWCVMTVNEMGGNFRPFIKLDISPSEFWNKVGREKRVWIDSFSFWVKKMNLSDCDVIILPPPFCLFS